MPKSCWLASVDGKHLDALYDVVIGADRMLICERGIDGTLTLVDSPVVAANPNAMVSTLDGSASFAAGNDGELEGWRRDADTGLLALADAQYDGGGGGNSLQDASGIAVSPDGENVYVGSSADDAIVVLRTSVPEPAVVGLGLAALGALATPARRRSAVP